MIQNKGKWDNVIGDTSYGIRHQRYDTVPVTHKTPDTKDHRIPHRILRLKQGDTLAPTQMLEPNDMAWLGEDWEFAFRGATVKIPKGTHVEILQQPVSNTGASMAKSTRNPALYCFYVASWSVDTKIVAWKHYDFRIEAEHCSATAETQAPPGLVI